MTERWKRSPSNFRTKAASSEWYSSIARNIAWKLADNFGTETASKYSAANLSTLVFDEAPYYKRTLKEHEQERLVSEVHKFLIQFSNYDSRLSW